MMLLLQMDCEKRAISLAIKANVQILRDRTVTSGAPERLYLQVRSLPFPGPGEPVVTASTRTHQHILVVDDTPTIRSLVAMILQDEGYEVTTACNGQEALAQITEQAPDLVLLDLQMPVMTGWELQEHLRSQGCCVPVVFMTAGPQARIEAERHHAAGYVAKPFDPDALVATIAQVALN
jgi:CheY-like chemotaxis protein